MDRKRRLALIRERDQLFKEGELRRIGESFDDRDPENSPKEEKETTGPEIFEGDL